VPYFSLRVWMPDRPGALSHVAGRIGAVKADVVALEILERSSGRAMDEIVVELSDPSLVGLLRSELQEVDGVEVEDVCMLQTKPVSLTQAILAAAGRLLETSGPEAVFEVLSDACRELRMTWAAIAGSEGERVLVGEPDSGRVAAVLEEVARSGGLAEDLELLAACFEQTGALLVAKRTHPPLRHRERFEIATLVRLADWRLAELSGRKA